MDLRLPSTQDWFFETFREGFPGLWLKPEGRLATRFQDMLPTLLGDLLGGNLATESIGLALRLFGANGLVYPSARCDPEVRIESGSLIDWNGFCLVDFRDALVQNSEVMGRQFLDVDRWDVPLRWNGLHGYLAELNPNTDEANRTRGSWYLRGICDAHARFFKSGGHLSSREIGSWPEYSPDEKLASTLLRLRRLTEN